MPHFTPDKKSPWDFYAWRRMKPGEWAIVNGLKGGIPISGTYVEGEYYDFNAILLLGGEREPIILHFVDSILKYPTPIHLSQRDPRYWTDPVTGEVQWSTKDSKDPLNAPAPPSLVKKAIVTVGLRFGRQDMDDFLERDEILLRGWWIDNGKPMFTPLIEVKSAIWEGRKKLVNDITGTLDHNLMVYFQGDEARPVCTRIAFIVNGKSKNLLQLEIGKGNYFWSSLNGISTIDHEFVKRFSIGTHSLLSLQRYQERNNRLYRSIMSNNERIEWTPLPGDDPDKVDEHAHDVTMILTPPDERPYSQQSSAKPIHQRPRIVIDYSIPTNAYLEKQPDLTSLINFDPISFN